MICLTSTFEFCAVLDQPAETWLSFATLCSHSFATLWSLGTAVLLHPAVPASAAWDDIQVISTCLLLICSEVCIDRFCMNIDYFCWQVGLAGQSGWWHCKACDKELTLPHLNSKRHQTWKGIRCWLTKVWCLLLLSIHPSWCSGFFDIRRAQIIL